MAKKTVEELALQEEALKAENERLAAEAAEAAANQPEGTTDETVTPGFKSAGEFAAYLGTVQDETLSTAYVIEQLNLIPVKGASVPRSSGNAGNQPRRGMLAGKALSEMSDEELKRETINAKSVLYKAKDRGAAAETIAANQARVDAVEAEKATRKTTAAPAEQATDVASDVPAEQVTDVAGNVPAEQVTDVAGNVGTDETASI